MALLLDTNAFLWWVADSPRLGGRARDAIVAADVYVSAVTGFEIATKRMLGKLEFDGDLEQQVVENGFRPLDVTFQHAAEAGGLPLEHRDPFDRLLIAQARREQLVIVTGDELFRLYDVPVLDASG